MFVALELTKNHGLFPKKKRLFQVRVPGGTPFCVIRCPTRRSVPWGKIQRLAGEQGSHLLLLPPDVTLPVGEGLSQLDLSAFYQALMRATFLRFLPLLRPFRRDLRLALVDMEGRLAGDCAELLRCARRVRILTDCPESYEDVRRDALAETGAAPLVSREMDALVDCNLVLAPLGTPKNLFVKKGAYCFGESPIPGAALLKPDGFQLSRELEALCPKGIPPIAFAGALYEKCGLKSLALQGYGGFSLKNRKISLAEGARYAAALDRESGIHYN